MTQGRSPIQLLVNFWEHAPKAFPELLSKLKSEGVREVTSFVPWMVFESDISHSLQRFLQAASQQHFKVHLIVTPEIGVHVLNSGVPKDLFRAQEHAAIHMHGEEVIVGLPPKIFELPSLVSRSFQKRYFGYLTKLQAFLAERALENVDLWITGSFYKYYRSPRFVAPGSFKGVCGDFSKEASLRFRKVIDARYSQSEFCQPNATSAQRWKTQGYDIANRKWFAQFEEDDFRHRNAALLGRGIPASQLQQVEWYTPEADPGLYYTHLLQTLAKANGSFSSLSRLIDQVTQRAHSVEGESVPPWVHFTALGAFPTLSDSEKQHLILKSLLLAGGRGGGVCVDVDEWFKLSKNFRSRADQLAHGISEGVLNVRREVGCLTPHLWSKASVVTGRMSELLKQDAVLGASVRALTEEEGLKVISVDPERVMTHDTLAPLLQWAEAGGLLVLPKTHFFTEAASRLVSERLNGLSRRNLRVGFAYDLTDLGAGRVLEYDPLQEVTGMEFSDALDAFLRSILSLVDWKPVCEFSDARLEAIRLYREFGPQGGRMALFVMNTSQRPVQSNVLFESAVRIGDLTRSLQFRTARVEGDNGFRFELEVPPFGVLPLDVESEKIREERVWK